MARITEEEADVLDKLWTKTTPPLKGGAGGFFTRQRDLLSLLDEVTATYIRSQAEITHQTPAEIIRVMVQDRIATSV
jgi:hypothetical protein